MTPEQTVQLIESAVEAAVRRNLASLVSHAPIQHGTVIELTTGGYGIHDVLLEGDIDPVPVMDITTGTPLNEGDRVTVMFAPPHQALIIGRVSSASDWVSYEPTFYNWTDESLLVKSGRYTRTGNTVVVEGGIEVPVGTFLNGTLEFSLPLPAHAPAQDIHWLFGGRLFRGDGGVRYASVGFVDPSVDPNLVSHFFTTGQTTLWGLNNPGTWGTGTAFDFFGTYETANDSD